MTKFLGSLYRSETALSRTHKSDEKKTLARGTIQKHMCPNSHAITTKCEAHQVHHQQKLVFSTCPLPAQWWQSTVSWGQQVEDNHL